MLAGEVDAGVIIHESQLTYRDEGLLKAAAILDLVYGSYDLVALLLDEYDRRSKTCLRSRYLDALRRRQLRAQFLNVVNYPK